ncbi:uncharacterized protein [Parasteatoda tepidariorum]|uniref:uncharacterized protein n=1 Tax=Parasteatoda tepidariorum TaxID=114398 RepID=UPI001C71C6AA|nr:uncharacterized protein LOC107441680 [Parasteatoda tepidariorum]XP_042903116.1 uncharacterized protein LOC107441680 [Parasteatoda tepidariorum]
MEDLPPSYGSLFNEHRSGLSYIDFLPGVLKEGFFCNAEYDRFENVIALANEWLKFNPQWKIKTCESIEFKDGRGSINPTEMVYYESTKYRTNFIRGLRLWLQIFPPGEERVQKIGYVNLVPEAEGTEGIFTHAKYETLDDVLLKFNNASRTSPLPGRIITIETQNMKIKSGGVIDPNRCSWTEYGERYTRFIYVIRIFYEVCEPLYEEIGINDFIPDIISTSYCGLLPKYEYLSTLFEKASNWSSSQSDLRICNLQSLEVKVHDGMVNPKKMSYTEHGNRRLAFARVLRVAYIRQQPLNYTAPVHLSYKSFVPAQTKPETLMTCYRPTAETLQETMQRVSSWIQATGAEVINMETSAIRLNRKGAVHSSEKNYSYETNANSEAYIFVIRAYLKGSYTEPYEDTTTPLRRLINPVFIIVIIVAVFLIVSLILFLCYFIPHQLMKKDFDEKFNKAFEH